ncbi:MAG: AzlD domain-containing protein [Clostridium sp.]|nr:AzlD domain-containing protein [Clostridium sp.]
MYIFICLIIMMVITYLIRMIPLAFFKKDIKSPFLKSLLEYIPYSILGAMTFPSIFYSTSNLLFSIIGTIVALLLSLLNKTLLTVSLSSVFTILLLNLIFN